MTREEFVEELSNTYDSVRDESNERGTRISFSYGCHNALIVRNSLTYDEYEIVVDGNVVGSGFEDEEEVLDYLEKLS